MTWPIELEGLSARLNLNNDRIYEADALRQFRTVEEILCRLATQPGIVLADEVGMGKTFVALGVAMMAALADRQKRPVVIMVPPSLHEKWPREFNVFKERAIQCAEDKELRVKSAASGLEFFRLLDNDSKNRPQIIFLKHGAFHVQNIDHWVRLALIKRAMLGMHLGSRRDSLPRFVARLLRKKSVYDDSELFAKLLQAPTREWRAVINEHYADRPKLQVTDAPIPEAVQKVLESDKFDVSLLRDCLRDLPARESPLIDKRLEETRAAINEVLRDIWPATLARAKFHSPLLILDEAHHLKNPATRLASLFVADDAKEDAQTISGALDGAFERMIFLTATPFQLGHDELLNVIGRFAGVAWRTLPQGEKEQFELERTELGKTLTRAQQSAMELDKRWGSLRQEDLLGQDGLKISARDWWVELNRHPENHPERIQSVLRAFEAAHKAMKDAEILLRKWVIRHLRDRSLPGTSIPRRERFVGRSITLGANGDEGLPVGDDALLPFLLAARAQAVIVKSGEKAGRATFADGLASSYEAFLDTRKDLAIDEEALVKTVRNDRADRYVDRLESALPGPAAYARHPKIAPLVARVMDLWSRGEKVVVFCHYRETGHALVRHLSDAMERRLWSGASLRLGKDGQATRKAVMDFSGRFDKEGGMRRPLYDTLAARLAPYPELGDTQRELIQDVVRRFIRTPLFVGRYFDVNASSGKRALTEAFDKRDGSGASLGDKIDAFLDFIVKRCSASEREEYLEALNQLQPGFRGGSVDDLSQGRGIRAMPNIRLANGLVRQETRQRLMLAFNTPFFPEVLVASSVLAEGVDLHLNCRYLIHHDLSWNPSTLEQRTGRIDRIGAKAEVVEKSIEVFLPYIGGTQDEKQYRVVMDRERWFQVLMGEDYRTDESFTEAAAERVPLPLAAAAALAFDLSVRPRRVEGGSRPE